MINDQLFQVLENDGLKAIDALDKPFDRISICSRKTNDKEKPNGVNVKVIQTGYMYKDKLLRPAMVKVNEWSEENGEDK